MSEQLTKSLSRSQFECHCQHTECTRTPVDAKLPPALQDVIDHFGYREKADKAFFYDHMEMTITSGYRCPKHNKEVGGSSNSAHIYGMAADFFLEAVYTDGSRVQIDQAEIADYLERRYPNQYGVGRYPRPGWPKNDKDTDRPRTHFDTRNDGPARWTA